MTFFKNRLYSIIIATIIAAIAGGQSGGDLQAQTIVSDLNDLKAVIDIISTSPSGSVFDIHITGTIQLDGAVPAMNVPEGVKVNIDGGVIDGLNQYPGLVINTVDSASQVNITNTAFNNCLANGNDAGLGGALSVHSQPTKPVTVTLTNVTFNNGKSGEGIYLNGSKLLINSGTDYTVSGNISDISATPDFDKWAKDSNGDYVLETAAGGVTVSGTNPDTVTLTGNNNYAGLTTIEIGATLIADGVAVTDSQGKTVHNAIGDLSEVRIATSGTLQLKQSETIGFLSGAGNVELNGKTLTISGDEDPEHFREGYNPVTGAIVGAFSGKIMTDTNGGELIKTGTGILTLNNDNPNTVDFTTTIYQGTVVLGKAKALGGGDVTIKNIDPGTRSELRNVIEANTDLTDADAVMNNFLIDKNYGAMVVGGNKDIQFGQAGVKGGQITGGNLLINMANATDKVFLANDGFHGAGLKYDPVAKNYIQNHGTAYLNNYAETQIYKGTVVTYEYKFDLRDENGVQAVDENGVALSPLIGTTLGKGSVHAIGLGGDAILSAGTNGMTISNKLEMDYGSTLTLSNEALVTALVTSYTISGATDGRGGLIVDLQLPAHSVTLTGAIGHSGATKIENGVLKIDPAVSRNSTTMYDLSASGTGELVVTTGNLNVNISNGSVVNYSGKITLNPLTQTLTKTGAGTWVFDGSTQVIDSINVNAGALQLSKTGTVNNVALSGSNGQLIVDDNNVILTGLSTESYNNNVTVTTGNTLTLNSTTPMVLKNTWTGGTNGTDATVVFGNDTVLGNINQKPADWKGTMEIAGGKTLTVLSPTGLGDADEAEVTLNNNSTLVINTYRPGQYSIYPTQIKQLNIADDSKVDVAAGSDFITKFLDGSNDVTKTGLGMWTMLGDSSGKFSGDVNLNEGDIYLKHGDYNPATQQYVYDSNWGGGTLNVTGDSGLLVDTGKNGRSICESINIDLGKTLNIGIVQNDKDFGSVTFFNITGDGGIDYYGKGTLVYDSSGIISYQGDTNIYAGMLDLQNVPAMLSNIIVHDGATLTGAGATTTKDMVFHNGSTLLADYAANGNNIPLYTANSVTIEDGAVAHIANSNGGGGTLMTTSTAGTGMFWFTNDVLGKRTVGEWSGNDLVLSFVDMNYTDQISTMAARGLADYLVAVGDNTASGKPWNPVYPIENETSTMLKALENVQSALPNQYDYALLEIGGQINPSLVTAQVQTTTSMFQAVTQQLFPASFFTEPCEDGFAVSGGTIYRGQAMRSGWTGWTAGLGGFGNTKDRSDSGASGYNYNSYGMSVGIEPTSAMSASRLGLFYAYTYTDIDTKKTLGTGNVSDHFVGAYGRFVDSLGYTSFVTGFGFDKYKTNRDVVTTNTWGAGGHSRSEFDGWQGGLYLERGMARIPLFGLQPYAGLQYLYSSTDEFTETGSNSYMLKTGSSEVNSLRSNLGVRLARQICRVRRGDFYLSGNVSWMYEFLDADCAMTSHLLATGNPSTFDVTGNSLGRNWAVVGAGMDWRLRHNLSLFGSYNLQVNSRQTFNIGTVGARVQW